MLKALRLLQEAKLELVSNGTNEIDLEALDAIIRNVHQSYEAKVGYNKGVRVRRQLGLAYTLSKVRANSEQAAANLEYLIEIYCQKESNSDLWKSLGRFLTAAKNKKAADLVPLLLEPIIINRFKKL
jgi:hypothetical protein